MRFGVCAGLDRAESLATAGWDFIELAVGTFLPDQPDQAYEPVRQCVLSLPLPVEACNCFIPGHLKLTGPEADLAPVLAYVEVACRRMAEAGVEVVVLGSGAARALPPGWSAERGCADLGRFLAEAGDIALECGLDIAIEPLCAKECNFINRVGQAVALARRVDHPAVGVLADSYHMSEEGEGPEVIECAAEWLEHVHIADTGRRAPGTGSYRFRDLLHALDGIGYDHRASVECGWGDIEAEHGKCLAYLRRIAAEVGCEEQRA